MNKEQLNLPEYTFRLKDESGKEYIFDEIRKKFLLLTPEEWVRQNFIKFLVAEKQYPASLIAIETGLKYNQLQKRADVLIYNKVGQADILIECKATGIKITQHVFDQIARYNMAFRVNYLIVTNGLNHFCCKMDYSNNSYFFLKDIPQFVL